MLVFEKQKVDMSRHSINEYGILHQIGSNYTFSFAGSQTGETFTFTLYDALNKLAQTGWEPHLYFEQLDTDGRHGTPTWIMRRAEDESIFKQNPIGEYK